eukprot:1193208-Prorocentrum_minimum.AAC.1
MGRPWRRRQYFEERKRADELTKAQYAGSAFRPLVGSNNEMLGADWVRTLDPLYTPSTPPLHPLKTPSRLQ